LAEGLSFARLLPSVMADGRAGPGQRVASALWRNAMKLETGWVRFTVKGKEARGYFARPLRAERPLPGVVLIQEAFGVDAFVRDVAERFATCGYATLAPDLFSLGLTPAPLTPDRISEARRSILEVLPAAWSDTRAREEAIGKLAPDVGARVRETVAALLPPERPWEVYVATLLEGRRWLSKGPAIGKKVGAVGFCLGGGLAMRLACVDEGIRATVSFYGVAPPEEQVARMGGALLGLYAENDPRVNATLGPLAAAMTAHGKAFAHHLFPGTRHAFFNDTRANYDVEASRDAWARTLTFFASHLG
jgi:carboxymethylenebutenolidase